MSASSDRRRRIRDRRLQAIAHAVLWTVIVTMYVAAGAASFLITATLLTLWRR